MSRTARARAEGIPPFSDEKTVTCFRENGGKIIVLVLSNTPAHSKSEKEREIRRGLEDFPFGDALQICFGLTLYQLVEVVTPRPPWSVVFKIKALGINLEDMTWGTDLWVSTLLL